MKKNKWKEKAKARAYEIKNLKKRIRDLEKSRDLNKSKIDHFKKKI